MLLIQEDPSLTELPARVLFSLGAGTEKTLIITAAMHGNEPSGRLAADRVFSRISEKDICDNARVVVVQGNMSAIASGKRYLDADLNRLWTPERTTLLESGEFDLHAIAEDVEQKELFHVLSDELGRATGDVTHLDLHSTSADTVPFVVADDDAASRVFASRFSLPMVCGWDDHIHGLLFRYFVSKGHRGIVVEGGQHFSPRTIDVQEAVITIALAECGIVRDTSVIELSRHQEFLSKIRGDIPPAHEVIYFHSTPEEIKFKMKPGFVGFQPVREGDLLGEDIHGAVTAQCDSRVFLPSYQPSDYGYVLVREAPSFS